MIRSTQIGAVPAEGRHAGFRTHAEQREGAVLRRIATQHTPDELLPGFAVEQREHEQPTTREHALVARSADWIVVHQTDAQA